MGCNKEKKSDLCVKQDIFTLLRTGHFHFALTFNNFYLTLEKIGYIITKNKIKGDEMRNWQVLKLVCLIVVALIAGVFVIGCGSSTNTDVATTTITTVSSVTTTTVAGSATISGQVAASSADLTSSGLMALSIVEPTFRTLANTGVTGATVSLYKIEADGTETDTGKIATTDASGNYSLTEVDVLTSGIYKTVAQKVVGGNTVEVSSLVVLSGASAETVNIAPEYFPIQK